MPTAAAVTYGGDRVDPLKYPENARLENLNLVNGTYLPGDLVGEVSATPGKYKKYASGNGDGSEIPTHVLQYGVVVASNLGRIGDAALGEWGAQETGFPAYRGGLFNSDEIGNLDANAVTVMDARFVRGNIADGGELLIPSA